MIEQPTRLTQLVALAPDVKWGVSFSGYHQWVSVDAHSALLPGGSGFCAELQAAGTRWHIRPQATRLERAEADFWRRFSDHAGDPFAGFSVGSSALVTALPRVHLTDILDGLRAVAATRERAAFAHTREPDPLRADIEAFDSAWACPLRVATQRYEDPSHALRVERLRKGQHSRPMGSWVLREIGLDGSSLHGLWWATRRGADDEARSVLSVKRLQSA